MASPDSRPRRPVFSLKTVLWITFAAACFFLGQQWDAFQQKSTRGNGATQLAVGESSVFQATVPVPQFQVADETVCSVVPIDATRFKVTAISAGESEVMFWGHQSQLTDLKVVVQ